MMSSYHWPSSQQLSRSRPSCTKPHLRYEAMDKFIAPEISTFTIAAIKDISAVSSGQDYRFWDFVLNSSLPNSIQGPLRPTLFRDPT